MSKIQQIVAIHRKEEARFPGEEKSGETMRWSALIAREDLGATSSEFADAMETLGVKRGTALNRWSDMVRNTKDD